MCYMDMPLCQCGGRVDPTLAQSCGAQQEVFFVSFKQDVPDRLVLLLVALWWYRNNQNPKISKFQILDTKSRIFCSKIKVLCTKLGECSLKMPVA